MITTLLLTAALSSAPSVSKTPVETEPVYKHALSFTPLHFFVLGAGLEYAHAITPSAALFAGGHVSALSIVSGEVGLRMYPNGDVFNGTWGSLHARYFHFANTDMVSGGATVGHDFRTDGGAVVTLGLGLDVGPVLRGRMWLFEDCRQNVGPVCTDAPPAPGEIRFAVIPGFKLNVGKAF